MSDHSSKTTTNHATIKEWITKRAGQPAVVRTTNDTPAGGILRIDFGDPEPDLVAISWDEFFQIFEQNQLQFLYQDQLESGEVSRFYKFTNRE